MAQCFDLAVLFQEPSDLEEFVYHVMELDGDEGALLIDYMRQMIRFFRRMGWEVTERT